MSVLFSCIGDSDPVRGYRDGGMLHIVRHYRPETIVLFLSAEMDRYNREDSRFQKCFDYISRSWENYTPNVQYIISEIEDPSDFDATGEELLASLDSCAASHQGEEILLNLSSGTPQMKLILAMAAVNTRYHTKGIQVKSPEKKGNTTPRANDKTYDAEEMLQLNEDEEPGSENRCSEPKLIVMQRQQQKERIRTMLELRDYTSLRSTKGILPPELMLLVEHLDERNHLETEKAEDFGKRARQTNKALFPLYPAEEKKAGRNPLIRMPEMTNYFLMLRNLQRTKDCTSFVLRLNPFVVRLQECIIDELLTGTNSRLSIRDILENKSINKNTLDPYAFQRNIPALFKAVNDEMIIQKMGNLDDRAVSIRLCNIILSCLQAPADTLDFFKNLENLNWQKRNTSAHELSEVSEDDIVNYSHMTSAKIINKLSEFLESIYPSWNANWAAIYDRCNQFILEKL